MVSDSFSICELLRSLHELPDRLLDPVGQGHEGGAEDEHAELPHGLGEARPQHCHCPKLTNQSHEETKQTNEHPKLNPGVGRDLLG